MLGRFQYNGCLKLFDMSARLGAALVAAPIVRTTPAIERSGGHGVPPPRSFGIVYTL